MFYITSTETFCKSNAIDDAKRNEGLKTPEDVTRFDDICYGEHERNILDVYRPKDKDGKLPVIVSLSLISLKNSAPTPSTTATARKKRLSVMCST